MRKKYKLLKDIHYAKAGTIVEEKCDDGTQDYVVIEAIPHGYLEKAGYRIKEHQYTVGRIIVENSPEFFERIEPLWLTGAQVKKVKKFLGI